MHAKVKAVGVVGAIVTLVVGALHQAGFDPTPAEVAAITTILNVVAGYLKSA